MKTLLINLAEEGGTASPPLGLWSMRTNIPGDVDIWDNAIDGDLLTNYEKGGYFPHYDVMGISARFSSQHADMLRYMLKGKALADKLVLGGPHASYTQTEQPYSNVCPPGEWGESFMLKKSLFIDDLNHPVFYTDELEPYWLKDKPHDKTLSTVGWMPIEFSRGCGKRCTFCCVTDFWGPLQRHSLYWITAYLTYLAKEHGIAELLIEDDSFDLSTDWAWDVIEEMNRLDMWWSTPNGLPVRPLLQMCGNTHEDKWKILTEWCWRVSIPFETGSPHTAKLMKIGNKYLHWEEAQELVLTLREHDIQVAGFFIIGYPGETPDDIRQTLAYANSLPLTDRYIYTATPYPGTALYNESIEHKLIPYKGAELYKRLTYRKSVFPGTPTDDFRYVDREFASRRKALKEQT